MMRPSTEKGPRQRERWAEGRLPHVTTSFVLLVSLVACSAFGQPFQGTQRLLLPEGPLRGSPRLMGIAGAFVGIAEGAEGLTRNPASAAAKNPKYLSELNFDLGFTLHFIPPWGTAGQDWDNDGIAEQASAGPFDFLGTQVVYVTGSLQWKWFGLGVGVDLQNFLNKQLLGVQDTPFVRYHNVALTHAFASLAASVWNDQIMFGIGIESTHGFVGYADQRIGDFLPSPKDVLTYHGWGVQLGAVYRPENADWRVGLSYKPQVTALPTDGRTMMGGYSVPQAIAVPGRLSLGGAIALGKGRHLNITSPLGWVPREAEKPDGPKTSAMMKWLITMQLDVFFPVQQATLVSAYLQQPIVDALPAGYNISFEPRLGIEKEVFLDILRLRLGGYLEPSMTTTGPIARPHLNFGTEFALFKLGHDRVGFGISFDFAHMYTNLSFGFMIWK